MKRHIRLLLAVMISFICCLGTYAQEQRATITGVVKDINGESIIGANVSVEGTTIGTITDMDGAFKLEAPTNGSLIFSFIGYETQKIKINKKTSFTITLKEDTKLLSEVVVTALGIKREKKALGYAMQEVKTDEFSENRSTSVSNLLQGKVAGVQISSGATGAGGAARVVMRGMKSLTKDNNALYVIDGVPIFNTGSSGGEGQYGDMGGSDAVADLNPDDIASVK